MTTHRVSIPQSVRLKLRPHLNTEISLLATPAVRLGSENMMTQMSNDFVNACANAMVYLASRFVDQMKLNERQHFFIATVSSQFVM